MRKVILTERDLEKIVKNVLSEMETNEDIFDPVRNVYQGVRGWTKGKGYDYFKYLSSLRNQLKTLSKLDEPNVKIFANLKKLDYQINYSKMDQSKKDEIKKNISDAVSYFDAYKQALDNIKSTVDTTLK